MKTSCFLPFARFGLIYAALVLQSAHAGSATWNLNPTSGDWNTAANGAQFSLVDRGKRKLTSGTVLTLIDNTAATPIAGTFANLPDGSTFTAGSNMFQASYEGGDGNDLTLTVVPQPSRLSFNEYPVNQETKQ